MIEEKYIIVCLSTSHMLKADKVLRHEGIETKLIPVPSKYGSVCSTGIRIGSSDKGRAENVLKESKVELQGIYPLQNHRLDRFWEKFAKEKLQQRFAEVLGKVTSGGDLNREEVEVLLAAEDENEMTALFAAADRMRREIIGDVVDIRGAVEFSNYCRKNCFYCGLQNKNCSLPRYRMKKEEIIEKAAEIKQLGMKTIILQSGEDDWYTTEKMTDIIRGIKETTGLRITLSIGERTYEEYRIFREAGANNYLLKIETTNPILFKAMHPDDDYAERLMHMQWLKELGYVVGSGNIVGIPNQTTADLASDIIYLHENGINMLGIGPFLPAAHTEFSHQPPGSAEMTWKVMATARLVCKNVYIPSTTALGTLDLAAQARGLEVGANTLMVNMTPEKYSPQYQIYSHKNNISFDDAVRLVRRLGRRLAKEINEAVDSDA